MISIILTHVALHFGASARGYKHVGGSTRFAFGRLCLPAAHEPAR